MSSIWACCYGGGGPFGSVASATTRNAAITVSGTIHATERVLVGAAGDARRSGGRSAQDARVMTAKTKGPAYLFGPSPTRTCDAAAPV